MIRSFFAFSFVMVGLLTAQVVLPTVPLVVPNHPLPANSQPVSPAKPFLDDKSYDFGIIPLGTEIRHTFTITNTNKAPLTIGKITISCDCTHLVAPPTVIDPGKTAAFQAVMNHHHTGYTDISIHVPTGPALKDLVIFHLIGILVDSNKVAAQTPDNFISAQEVLQKKDVILVDVRDVKLFVQAHAVGAQNIPLFALRARPDLFKRSVVVINDGTSDNTVLEKITSLKQQGFTDLHLLKDGYPGWKLAGGPVSGINQLSLSTLKPSDFYAEQARADGWLIVSLDGNTITSSYHQTKASVNDGSFINVVQDAIATQRPTRILVMSNLGNEYEQTGDLLKSITVPIFYLQGGIYAYTSYIQEQTLAAAPKTIKLNPDQDTLASSRATGQVIRGGGCASCGH